LKPGDVAKPFRFWASFGVSSMTSWVMSGDEERSDEEQSDEERSDAPKKLG